MMGKELSEMTLEELWDLFPIFLVQHDDQWNGYYEEIEAAITDLLKDYQIKRISHIGSTAIQGIWVKNIVDVMVEISEKADMEEVAHILEQNGFIRMSDEKRRISLNKGYTKEGFADKVYHIHLRYTGDNDELYFRDYLNLEENGMDKDKVRVIKISKEALFEYVYENFIANQDEYLDVDKTEVSDFFDIDYENGCFIFCAIKSEDEDGNILSMPAEINLQKLMKIIPDTTDSMLSPTSKYYKEYSKDELTELSKF